MKRPLAAVCVCIVAVIAFLLMTGRFEGGGSSDGSQSPFREESGNCPSFNPAGWDNSKVIVTGHVCRKDVNNFYLDSVLIQNQAAGQQQIFSLSENLICEYEEEGPPIGSTVKVRGVFSCFDNATNPGEFDGAEYYRSLGICGRLYSASYVLLGEDYSVWQEALFALQQYFRERLYCIFPEKEASVMAAMLLGDKSELDGGIKELFQDNGIIHILSISGLHISIIGMSIYKLLRRIGLPVWAAALAGGTVLLLYGIMTGMSTSACRAIGMFLIRMLAEITGRTYDMLTALGVMAAGMAGANPYNLKNAGFLLSFGSILGIGALYPALLREGNQGLILRYEEKKWKRVCREVWAQCRDGLEQSILSGLSVTLATLPIQLWFYYEIPTYSVLLNLLVLPLMTWVMLSGIIAMLIPGLGIVGTVDCIILSCYEWLCRCFERLPFSRCNPGRPELWQVILYYVILVGVIMVSAGRKAGNKVENNAQNKAGNNRLLRKIFARKTALNVVLNIALTTAVIIMILPVRRGDMVAFLDVGQGDCICVITDEGECFLFDCGSSDKYSVGVRILLPFLQYHGISRIDGIFLSHADEDHCNGIMELLQSDEIEIGVLYLPELGPVSRETFGEIIAASEGVEICYVAAGDCLEGRGLSLTCLHPGEGYEGESNAGSACYLLELEEFSMLLTGDAEGDGEEALKNELQERKISYVDVLKVAHHGSAYSTSEDFLGAFDAKIAVISCGKDNSYGHPHRETLQRLGQDGTVVLTTPEYGAITVETGEEMEVRSWMQPTK